MFGYRVLVLSNVLRIFKFANPHFIPVSNECNQANVCNHTWVPQCGIEKTNKDKRIFSDDCTMHEFNCDNKKDYYNVNMTECKPTTKTTDAANSTSYDGKCTCSMTKTSTTTASTTPTHSSTSSISTPTTDNPMNRNCTRNVTTASEIVATTELTTSQLTANTTTSEPTTKEETTTEGATITIKSTTQLETTVTTSKASITTQVTTTTPSVTTSKKTTATPLDTTTMTSSKTAMTTQTTTIVASSTTTDNITTHETAYNTTIPSITTAPINNNTVNVTCPGFPADCNRPTTWQTTPKNETRDFYQILKAKYGDRVKLIKGTTHWPRKANVKIWHDSFVFGRHVDS